MANVEIGQVTCPLCKSAIRQTVKVSEKSGKPYLNCEECGMQLFARQPASVKLLRGMAEPNETSAPAPAPAPVAHKPKPPAPPKPAKAEPAPAPVTIAQPAPAKRPAATFFG